MKIDKPPENYPQAAVAVFRVDRPADEPEGGGETPWFRMLRKIYSAENCSDTPITIPSCVQCLQLPTKLPILCQYVEAAREYGLSYKVELFGPALLTFDSTSTSDAQANE